MAKKDLNLGELCDAIQRKDDEIDIAEAKVKELRTESGALRDRLLLLMEQTGTEMARGTLATVSKSTLTHPRVVDWDAFYRYVQRNNGYHLLQRRLSVEAVRDEVEKRRGKELPGTETFEQIRLKVTRIK